MAWIPIVEKFETVAYWFDKTNDPATFPNKLNSNVNSPTGFSWGSLDITEDSMDGFAVPDKVWIIKDRVTDVVYWLNDSDFKKKFKLG